MDDDPVTPRTRDHPDEGGAPGAGAPTAAEGASHHAPGPPPAATDGGADDPPGGGPGVAVVRPPRAPLKVMVALAGVTVPLAVLAVAQGDGGLGFVALLSAGWAGSVAYVGWTASAVADAGGVTIHWLRRSQSVRWSEVRRVVVDRSGPGGTRRGARFLLDGDRSLPWTPWVTFFWFAHASANRSVADLEVVAAGAGLGPITDPGDGSPPD